ncbi:unnamed protein product [Nezara viridula]|uniref:Uncharacterized protein n=1 Tax=Nezara viridula TaxID=85310 RepID=A0A9P0HJB7_NEZVI|nr:unnamed protein product [Nezara viridula]
MRPFGIPPPCPPMPCYFDALLVDKCSAVEYTWSRALQVRILPLEDLAVPGTVAPGRTDALIDLAGQDGDEARWRKQVVRRGGAESTTRPQLAERYAPGGSQLTGGTVPSFSHLVLVLYLSARL